MKNVIPAAAAQSGLILSASLVSLAEFAATPDGEVHLLDRSSAG